MDKKKLKKKPFKNGIKIEDPPGKYKGWENTKPKIMCKFYHYKYWRMI